MGKKVFLVDIDLNGNKLLNAAIEVVSELPAVSDYNRIVIDETDGKLAYWNGTKWVKNTEEVTLKSAKDYTDEVKAALLGNDESTADEDSIEGVRKYIASQLKATNDNFTKLLDDEVKRAEGKEKDLEDAITLLNGDATTEGSVAKSVADAVKALKGGASTLDTFKKVETKIAEVEEAFGNQISDLDAEFKEEDHKVITGIKQVDGVITEVTKKQLDSSDISATPIEGNQNTVAVTGNTVAMQVASLAASVKAETNRSTEVENGIIGTDSDEEGALTLKGLKKAIDANAESNSEDLENLKKELIGGESDTLDSASITGAKLYADDQAAAALANAKADATTKSDKALADAKADSAAKIAALNVEDTAVDGEFITEVSESEGKISVKRSKVAASKVTVEDADDNFNGTNVEAVLEELYSQAGAGSKVTITEEAGTGDILKTYTIKQGGTTIGTINIAKDLVVEDGDVIIASDEEGLEVGKMYLKLIIANKETPLYIPVDKLVDVYTSGNGILVDANNKISVVLDPTSEKFLSLGEDGIKLSGVQKAIESAVNEAKETVDEYTVNGKKISENSVINGADIKLDGYEGQGVVAPTAEGNEAEESGAGVLATDTVNDAIAKLEMRVNAAQETANGGVEDAATAQSDVDKLKPIVNKLNGTDTVEGSVAYQVKEAKETAAEDAKTKADKALEDANKYTDDAIEAAVGAGIHSYQAQATSGTSISILANIHKCGTLPMVRTYWNGEEVLCGVKIDATGNVTISWNGSEVTAEAPIAIKIIG